MTKFRGRSQILERTVFERWFTGSEYFETRWVCWRFRSAANLCCDLEGLRQHPIRPFPFDRSNLRNPNLWNHLPRHHGRHGFRTIMHRRHVQPGPSWRVRTHHYSRHHHNDYHHSRANHDTHANWPIWNDHNTRANHYYNNHRKAGRSWRAELGFRKRQFRVYRFLVLTGQFWDPTDFTFGLWWSLHVRQV